MRCTVVVSWQLLYQWGFGVLCKASASPKILGTTSSAVFLWLTWQSHCLVEGDENQCAYVAGEETCSVC